VGLGLGLVLLLIGWKNGARLLSQSSGGAIAIAQLPLRFVWELIHFLCLTDGVECEFRERHVRMTFREAVQLFEHRSQFIKRSSDACLVRELTSISYFLDLGRRMPPLTTSWPHLSWFQIDKTTGQNGLFKQLSSVTPPTLYTFIISCNRSNTRKSVSSDIQTLREKWVDKTRRSRVFFNNFEVFGYLMKHYFD